MRSTEHKPAHSRRYLLLGGGVSALALALAGVAAAQPAPVSAPTSNAAQQAASQPTVPTPDEARAAAASGDEGTAVEEVVVTGTRIRGVAPVGAPVIGVSRETLQRTGVVNTTDVLRRVPQVTNYGADDTLIGGASVQNSVISITLSRAVNLRGLGTTATLSLVNGFRSAPGGVNASVFDADAIPSAFIQRVEVVADGASAIYGSDAVAGVVNYVLRRNFDGLETTARIGGADGTSNYLGSVVYGRTWEGGSIAFALETEHRDALEASDRAEFYNDNLIPYGGSGGVVQSSPGNVTINGVAYAVPAGQAGRPLLLSQLGTPGVTNLQSVWRGVQAIPEQERYSLAGTAEQRINETFQIFGQGFFSRRDFSRNATAITGNNLSVPANNPFSPCNPANNQTNPRGIVCAGSAVTVNYSFLDELGPSLQNGYQEQYAGTAGLRFELPADWRGEVAYTRSGARDLRRTYNQLNSAALTRALNATTAATAGITPFDPFCDARNLSCNSASTLNYFRGTVYAGSRYVLNDYNVKFDGPIYDLPAGSIRIAIGAEYHDDSLRNYNANNTTTTDVGTVVETIPQISRDVTSVFGEMYIPVVGEPNAINGIQRLDVVLAVRYENYSDFGETTNPRLGVSYVPIDGWRLRASYGTSFRAPTLCDINLDCTIRYLNQAITSADLAAAGLTGTGRTAFFTGGGTPGLQPEEATTYSFGLNIQPPQVPGLNLDISYYNIDYQNRIDTPGQNVGFVTNVTNPLYSRFVTFNPTFFPAQAAAQGITQAQFNAIINGFVTSPRYTGGPVNQANVVAVINGNRQNTGTLRTNGIDLQGSYELPAWGGTFRIGASGTYVLDYETSPVPGAPLVDQNNKFGYTLTFRGRGEIGWSDDNWAVSAFVNYANDYELGREFTLAAAPQQYLYVDSFTTVDLTLSYTFTNEGPLSFLDGTRITLSSQNVFDEPPPFVLNASATPILFDPTNASVLGRTWGLQLTRRW